MFTFFNTLLYHILINSVKFFFIKKIRMPVSLDYWSLLIFILFALPLAIIDIKELRLPDFLTLPLYIFLLISIAIFNPSILMSSIFASVISMLLFYCVGFFTKPLGGGDIKLVASVALLCGYPLFFIALLTSVLCALLYYIFLLFKNKAQEPIPFGPFLATGGIITKLFILLFL